MIIDQHGRTFSKLRVSLTSACNYACTYCVAPGKRLKAEQGELSAEKLVTAIRYLIESAGIKHLRITGGEPLISKKLDSFLWGIRDLDLETVSVTSNGQQLIRKLPTLLAAGVSSLNISLDTLDSAAFRRIARGGDLSTVLNGLELARNAGMKVKLNMVPLRGENLDQVLPMLSFALVQGFELRFIELMRMGHLAQGSEGFQKQFVGMPELLDLIAEHYAFTRAEAPKDSTAVRYRVGTSGTFGVIPNESAPFCRECSRLRLSAQGWLHGCLSSTGRYYLGEVLGLPPNEALAQLRPLLWRALRDKQEVSFTGSQLIMKSVGG